MSDFEWRGKIGLIENHRISTVCSSAISCRVGESEVNCPTPTPTFPKFPTAIPDSDLSEISDSDLSEISDSDLFKISDTDALT